MDNVLLGYVPRKSFGSASPKTPSKSSDFDFHDVFGGPPRRSSMQDWRSSLGSGEEEANSGRDPWSGLSDRPVFGEESSSSRKKYHSDDFFDDIFRGDESSGSTPRKLSRDPLSSSPASRVSSPARALSFQSESQRGPSLSLPPVLSLPEKLSKEMDSSAFPSQNRNPSKNKETALIGFPSSPGASTSRFSVQVKQRQEGLKTETRSSYRHSSLSKEVPLNSEGSSQAPKSDKRESEEDSNMSEVTYNSTQFHFSIHKWASTVVPITMPLRKGNISSSKDRNIRESMVNVHAAEDLLVVERPSNNDNMLEGSDFFQGAQESQDDKSVCTTTSDMIDSPKVADEVVSTKPLSSFQNIFRKVQGSLQSQNVGKNIKAFSTVDSGSFGGSEKRMPVFKKEVPGAEEPLYCLLNENKPGSTACDTGSDSIEGTKKRLPTTKDELPMPEEHLYCLLKETKNDTGASGADKELFGSTEKTVSISKKEATKTEVPLYCLLRDESGRQGSGKAIDKPSLKKSTVKSNQTSSGDASKDKKAKKQTGKRNILKPANKTSSVLQDGPIDLEQKSSDNKSKGKVKDFVKIFNQEVPEKPFKNVETRDRGDIIQDIDVGRAVDQTSSSAAKSDEKKNNTAKDIPPGVDRRSKQFVKPQREIKTAEQVSDFAFRRNNRPTSSSETVNIEEPCEDFDCTVKVISQDQNNQAEAGPNPEEFQASDARIKKWSLGKEGNIRSLLSTLQYVLWSESGWKPVPLVDIIEGSSVRRAYQKALLCLHPDKLQQKGAAPHQKYIAEKVFDILQDAWTHFNSLGTV